MKPTEVDSMNRLRVQAERKNHELRSALLWLLWHHQGASSVVGLACRRALGIGQYTRMTDAQVERAKEWGEWDAPPDGTVTPLRLAGAAGPLGDPEVRASEGDWIKAIADEFRRAIPTPDGATLAAMIEQGVTVLESHIRYACESVAEPALRASLADLDAEADRIAEAAYSADYDAAPAIKALVRRAAVGVPLPPATFRQGNWEHPDHIGRIVGWIIPNDVVQRMGADAFCLPGEVEDALRRLAAAHGEGEVPRG